MWMLSLMPDWIFHLILIAGILAVIAGKFLKSMPFVSQYNLPIQIAGVVLTVIGIWFNGSISADNRWKEKVAELEEKVRIAEVKSSETNTAIETVFVDRVKVVKEIQYRNINDIEKNASNIDANCMITPSVIDILNNSAGSGHRK
jgi:uncharacterized membrane protein